MRRKRKLHVPRRIGSHSLQRLLASLVFCLFPAACGAPPVISYSDCPLTPSSFAAQRLAPPGLGLLDPAPTKTGVPFSNQEIARLNRAFKQSVPLTGATAASIAIARSGGGSWSATAGVPREGPKSFWWASVGKLVTATIILQMVEERSLTLDQTIQRWFPDLPGADRITVDHLLTHTSGLYTYNYDRKFRQDSGYHSPAQLIAVATAHGPDFCPGTQWHYSNTGYVMLGVIAEQIDGAPLAAIVKQRIARPLGLKSLRLLTRESTPEMVAPFKGQTQADTLVETIASGAGAGGIVAEPDDMIRLLQAWIRGPLLSTKSRNHALRDVFPMFGQDMGYGRGIMVMPVPDARFPTMWLGHLGGSPHSKGVLIFDLKRQTYVALALNTGGEGEALVNTLLKALDAPNN